MIYRAILAVALLAFSSQAAEPPHACAGAVDASFSYPGVIRPNVIFSDGSADITVGTHEGGLRLSPVGLPDPHFRLDARDALDYPSPIFVFAMDSDDRWLVGGHFAKLNDAPRGSIARLLPNSAIDTTFAPQAGGVTGANASVHAIALQGDEHILIGGSFTHYDGVPRTNIARLNVNGTLDTSFDPGAGANGPIFSIAVQNDGRILVAGSFNSFNEVSVPFVCRLLPSGAIDSSFTPPPIGSTIHGVHLLPEGKILVHGIFGYSEAPATPNFIARLNSDGTLDTTFTPRVDGAVKTFALQADGKYLIGGTFQRVDGAHHHLLARILPNGRLDPTFESGIQMLYGCGDEEAVYSITLDAAQRVYVGGSFFEVNGLSHQGVTRLFNDTDSCPGLFHLESETVVVEEAETTVPIRVHRSGGATGPAAVRLYVSDYSNVSERDFTSIETILHFGPGETLKTAELPIHQDSQLEPGEVITLALSEPTNGAGLRHPTFLRVTIRDEEAAQLPGSVDLDFNPPLEAGSVTDVKRLPNGQLLVSGYFGEATPQIVRLNANGTVDAAFSFSATYYLGEMALWNDKVYVIAIRNESSTILRLNSDGTIDDSFAPPAFAMWNQFVGLSAIAAQSDGKVLIGGAFTGVNGTSRSAIARVNTDGAVDTTFNPGAGVELIGFQSRPVEAISVLNDGTILIAGRFSRYDSRDRNSLAHLSATGALLDDYLPPHSGPYQNEFHAIAQQADGKILVAGNLRTESMTDRAVLRFSTAGTLDETFRTAITSPFELGTIAIDPTGNILVAALLRLQPNGRSDPTFYFPDQGRYSFSEIIALPDGDVIVAGSFAGINGIARPGLARINGGAYTGPGVIAADSVFVTENMNVATIRVLRSVATEGELQVRYTTAARNAQPGRDYVETTGTLTFAPGVTEQLITIPILNDNEFREMRSFAVELQPLTLNAAVLLNQPELTVTISDDDTEFVLSIPAEVPETHGVVTIYVLRQGPSQAAASVRLDVTSGTATEGADFVGLSGTVEFLQNSPMATIEFNVLDDSLPEETETIRVRLSEASGGIILDADAEGTIRLVDNATRFGFTASQARVHEGAGVARIEVEPTISHLQPDGAPNIVVNYRTIGGTAQPNVDYIPVEGQLIFNPRQVSPEAIRIPLIVDREATGVRSLQVELTGATGEAIIDRSELTLTIVDDGRIIPPGAVDERFHPFPLAGAYPWIYDITPAPDFLYVAGYFPVGEEVRHLIRLSHDGALDENYRPQLPGVPAAIRPVAGQKLLIAGPLATAANSRILEGVARLNLDGTIDASFNAELPGSFVPESFSIDAQDRIVLAGYFDFGGNIAYALRLLPDGRRDGSFESAYADLPWNYSEFSSVAHTADGKILVAGSFTRINGQEIAHLARLNANGTIDETFRVTGLTIDHVSKIKPLPDGKTLIIGQFNEGSIARLNSNGAVDPTFTPPQLAGTISDISLDAFGRIWIAGDFLSIGQSNQSFLARLLPDGAIDDSFFPPSFDGALWRATPLFNGLYVSGGFWHVDGEYRPLLARLFVGSPAAIATPIVSGNIVSLQFNFPVGNTYVVESTPDFGEWTEVSRGTTTAGIVTVEVPASESRLFYRVRETR